MHCEDSLESWFEPVDMIRVGLAKLHHVGKPRELVNEALIAAEERIELSDELITPGRQEGGRVR
jgi:hypothetical protein